MHETNHVAVLDFGSQYTQLIVRRVRELGYYARLYPLEEISNIGKPGAVNAGLLAAQYGAFHARTMTPVTAGTDSQGGVP